MPTTPTTAPARSPSAWPRLGTRTRRLVLITHIASAGAWLGVDVAMAVLIATAVTTDDPGTLAFSLQALELVSIWPLLACGLLCLLSGTVLGLGGKWGLLRYWWVAVKLVLNLVLTGLVLVALLPEVTDQADRARRLAAGEAVTFDLSNLIYPPTVSPALLLVAIALSVIKPWGRIRRHDRRPPGKPDRIELRGRAHDRLVPGVDQSAPR
jgi:uncharacterized membrane protein